MPMNRTGLLALVYLLAACSAPRDGIATDTASPTHATAAREYLYLWTASADSTQPDFLAVVDITANDNDTARYGRLVTTLAVPGRMNRPHHTEHELPADRQLFANGFATGRTFVFDLSTPDAPKLAADFTDLDGYQHPHSFLRLPNGNVLATYQMRHTAATLMLAAGENPEWVAQTLGHSTTEMLFRVYSRYVPNLTRNDGGAYAGLLTRKLDVETPPTPAAAATPSLDLTVLSIEQKAALIALLTQSLTSTKGNTP